LLRSITFATSNLHGMLRNQFYMTYFQVPRSTKRLLAGLFGLLLGATTLWAQRPPAGVGGTGRDGASTTTNSTVFAGQEDFDDRDTFGVFSFLVNNPNRETPFSDSLLGYYFHQYDPARRRDIDLGHLGNLGSAHQPIFFQTFPRKGFDIGLHQFDAYLTRASDLPFYRLEKAYTNVGYTQGSEQADSYFTAQFSRNFADGLNFSIDYERISQIGQQDQYANQNTRNTALATGLWFHGKGGRYDGFFIFANNTIEQEDNGGLVREPALGGEFESPSSAEVFLEDGQTRHAHREFQYTQYYRFGGQADTTGRQRRAFTLSHQINLMNSAYKFFDPYSIADTGFYQRFPQLQTDERGARFFLDHRAIENSFRISTYKLRDGAQKNVARDQRDLLEAGLTHIHHRVRQEGAADTVLNNLLLHGRWLFQPNKRLRFDAFGHLNLWDNGGDYQVGGELLLDFGKIGALNIQASNQLYSPNLLQHRLYLTQQPLWENNFRQTLETNVRASYHLSNISLEVGGGYYLFNQFIYFDTLGIARQTGLPLSVLQFVVKKNFKFWRFHLDNTLTLQKATEDVIRLPEVFGKHSLYYAGTWFRVLDVQLGVDLRWNTDYLANYYNPFIGQFHLQNAQETRLFPALDAFFSMRVRKFRAFLKFENMGSLFAPDQLYYQTAFYAFPDAALRWGIKWRLVN